MKRLAYPPPTAHIADCIEAIVHIIVQSTLESNVHCSADTLDDEYYSQFTDSQLLELTDSEIRGIRNIQLIHRIAKADSSRLSAHQLKSLRGALRKKFVIDASDVSSILTKLKQCQSISYYGRHRKTNDFLFDDAGAFRADVCHAILNSLEVDDYVASTRSMNFNHLGNHLIIFEPDADFELDDGSILAGLTVYVKLDVDESNGKTVALVTMHVADHVDPKPYSQNKEEQ